MPASVATIRRVEFSDTDMAGIMHFTAFFRLMEAAEHELLRSLGLTVFDRGAEEHISWPRVSAACDFRAPAQFGDDLTIEASVYEIKERSVTYHFNISRDGQLLAEGSMISVCCIISSKTTPKSIPIPDWIRKRLEGVEQK